MCIYVHVHLPKILCTFDPIVYLGLDLSGGLEICGEPSILGFNTLRGLLAPDTARASASSWLSYPVRVMKELGENYIKKP